MEEALMIDDKIINLLLHRPKRKMRQIKTYL